MLKFCARLVIVLVPVLLIIGFIRVMVGHTTFLPTYEEIYLRFSAMPALNEDVMKAVATFNYAIEQNSNAWANINNIVDFFNSVGAFFGMVGSMFMVGFQALVVPFKFLQWFFAVLLGFNAPTVSA